MLNSTDRLADFRSLTQPIVAALRACGIHAQFGGRNDLLIGGAKFSGNAQTVARGVIGDRLLHHGTLLFHSDFGELSAALNVRPDKIIGKGIKSVRSRVTNISEHSNTTIDDFIQAIADQFPPWARYELTEADIRAAELLALEKYRTWEWNYGCSPPYSLWGRGRFVAGDVEAFIDVNKNGLIEGAKIYGDFFGRKDISDIENVLIGSRPDETGIRAALFGWCIEDYFMGITLDELMEVFK